MPATLDALAIILLFSVPAYLSITFYKRKNPGYYFRNTQTSVEEIALYVFLGTVVNVFVLLSISILGWISNIVRSYLPSTVLHNIDNWIFSFGSWTLYLFIFLLYSILGTIIAIGISNTLYYFMPDNPPMFMKELSEIKITQQQGAQHIPWLLVKLKNGDSCLGLASEARWVGDKDNSIELSLDKTYYQNADNSARYEVGRLVLRSDDVLWLGLYRQ